MAIWGGGPQALWQDKLLPTRLPLARGDTVVGPSVLAMTAQRHILITNFGDTTLASCPRSRLEMSFRALARNLEWRTPLRHTLHEVYPEPAYGTGRPAEGFR